ncbi:MAG: hypothetical protein WC748_08615 [Legionellales bacterium]|jgi:hypothetical protein
MRPTQNQLRNLQALEWLDQQGNYSPTQAEIDEIEKMLLACHAAFKLTGGNKNQKEAFK